MEENYELVLEFKKYSAFGDNFGLGIYILISHLFISEHFFLSHSKTQWIIDIG